MAGVRSLLAFWMGGAEAPSAAQFRGHMTDARGAYQPARAHVTNALGRGAAVPPHATDTFVLVAAARVQAVNAYMRHTAAVSQATDTVRLHVAARTHTANTLVRTTRVLVYATNSQAQSLTAQQHTTGAFLRRTTTRNIATDARLRGTRSRTHTADTQRRATAIRTHAVNAMARRTLIAFSFVDVQLKRRPPGNRGFTQRIGARTARSEGLNARQQGGIKHPLAFIVYDLAGVPAPGRVLTVSLSKDGGVWVPAQGVVTDAGLGWYSLAGHPADRDTAGELLVHVESADPFVPPLDLVYDIIADDPHALPSLSGQERTALADATLARSWIGLRTIARTAFNALRYLRNRRTLDVNNILRVHVEDDATIAWLGRCTAGAGASPVRGVDPDT